MAHIWTPADVALTFERVKNWGRFGAADERGALNFITAAKRAAAAALVREGHAVSCARELPVLPSVENPVPAHHHMLRAGDDCVFAGIGLEASMDYIGVAFHGQATSHLDALCHVFVQGRMYNGFPATDVKSTGAQRCSVMTACEGIVSRGVFVDLPRHRGGPWLDPGEVVRRDELEAAVEAQGMGIEEGDVLLVGTGRDARRAAEGVWNPFTEGLAGLHPDCVPWLHEVGIAVLGCDGVSDPVPGLGLPGWRLPVHQCCLVAMGVPLLDNLALAELAAACAERRRYEFLLVVAPLRVEGGTGSPVNPIAVF
jgi:kynurenine formamidase